jgi:tRNA 2-thiocytidine biosynthesis protein TtcA
MIEDGDTVLVCVSGGKDSYTLLSYADGAAAARAGRFPADRDEPRPEAAGLPGRRPARLFREDRRRIPHRRAADTYSIVKEKIPEGKTTCSLCSRLRRGIIYRTAKELGANKIALGHHRDDMVHTLFLNLLFGGKIKAMPPKLVTDDGATCRHPPAGLLRRSRHRPLSRAAWNSRSSLATCAVRRRTCSGRKSAK